MRLTIREFNHVYNLYKDNFDLELMLTLSGKTYKTLKQEAQKSQEWF
jgi:hypothetical protein